MTIALDQIAQNEKEAWVDAIEEYILVMEAASREMVTLFIEDPAVQLEQIITEQQSLNLLTKQIVHLQALKKSTKSSAIVIPENTSMEEIKLALEHLKPNIQHLQPYADLYQTLEALAQDPRNEQGTLKATSLPILESDVGQMASFLNALRFMQESPEEDLDFFKEIAPSQDNKEDLLEIMALFDRTLMFHTERKPGEIGPTYESYQKLSSTQQSFILNLREEAVNILQKLLDERPDYRGTQTLLESFQDRMQQKLASKSMKSKFAPIQVTPLFKELTKHIWESFDVKAPYSSRKGPFYKLKKGVQAMAGTNKRASAESPETPERPSSRNNKPQ